MTKLSNILLISFFSFFISIGLFADNANWWENTSIYHVYINSFCDSDGDGHGDLDGVTSKLDYLQDMGIETIWLSPIMNAMDDHGYNVIDYKAIDPDYGTMADFEELIAAAHSRGMRVFNDLVINHCGTEHTWFKDGNKNHWFIWKESDYCWDDPWNHNPAPDIQHQGKTWIKDPQAWMDRNGDGDAHNDDYYYSVFGDEGAGTMPDLNYNDYQSRQEIVAEVKSIMSFWFDKGLDGFRCDASRYLVEDGPGKQADEEGTHDIWQDFRSWIDTNYPQRILLAEGPTESQGQLLGYYGYKVDDDGNALKVDSSGRYTGTYGYDRDEYHSAFHFGLHWQLTNALKSGKRQEWLFEVMYSIQQFLPKNAQDTIFLSNHDAIFGERVATQMEYDSWKMKGVANLYLLLSGNPTVYYAEELGYGNVSVSPDENQDNRVRGKINWDDAANQEQDPKSYLNHYRNTLKLRMAYDALRGGMSYFVPTKFENGAYDAAFQESETMSIVREYYGEKILVVHTFGSTSGNVYVNLKDTGLDFSDGQAYVLMDYDETTGEWTGGGRAETVTANNVSNYPVGYMNGKTTTVIFLGDISKYGSAEKFPNWLPDEGFVPPRNVKVCAGDKEVAVSWNAVPGANLGYAVYYTEGDDPVTKTSPSVNVSGTAKTITGLTNGTKYNFAVTARKTGEESDLSEQVCATPGEITGLKVHFKEWESADAYSMHCWNGLTGGQGMTYNSALSSELEGSWWTVEITNVLDSFSFTFTNSNGNWEGSAGLYDRTYVKANHGNEIFVEAKNSEIYLDSDKWKSQQKDLVVHFLEWESCYGSYNLHGWDGLSGDSKMSCEGYKTYAGKSGYWWKVTITNVPDSFKFTFNNTNGSWEGSAGQYDRQYVKSRDGNEIYIICRDTAIYK